MAVCYLLSQLTNQSQTLTSIRWAVAYQSGLTAQLHQQSQRSAAKTQKHKEKQQRPSEDRTKVQQELGDKRAAGT